MFGTSAASALGRPNLEAWDLFTRETLQNSWDARDLASDEDGVTFSIDYVELTGYRSDALRQFFDGQTMGLPKLEDALGTGSEIVPLLLVNDAGTVGLQGPTSAATSQSANTREDFVSFIRNIGRPSSKELKGGTYGFGKGVLFNMSECNTVLVYTRTVDESFNPVSRFIAMANSDGFTEGDARYTGRHWWGVEHLGKFRNPYAEPLTGIAADSLARTFCMDRHFTEDRKTGTSIAVIAPRVIEGDSGVVENMMEAIAAALTKWAWPHMVETVEGLDPIDFSVSRNGIPVPIPDPESDPLVSQFVKAYRTCLSKPEPRSSSQAAKEFQRIGRRKWVDICSKSPGEFLGRLAVSSYPVERIQQPSVLDTEMGRHVALMRNPRMVVTYWCGPKNEVDENYAGVFIAARHLDPVFAASEPTAHDEWNPATVDLQDEKLRNPATGAARSANPVRIALRELTKHLKPKPDLQIEDLESGPSSQITAIANQLGNIFSGATGTSPRVTLPDPRSPQPPSKPKGRDGVSSEVELHDLVHSSNGVIAIFRVKVVSSEIARDRGLEVHLNAAALVDGKKANDEDDVVNAPSLLGWIQSHEITQDWETVIKERLQTGPSALRMRVENWEGYYAVLQPRDTAITAELAITFDSEEN
ncbi:hypothetical protein [Corynebacterium sanguinis]